MSSLENRTPEVFFENTRVSPHTFSKIVQIVNNYVGPNPPYDSLPYGAKYAVHAALNYLGNSSAYRCTGEILGIPRSKAFDMTSTVINALIASAPDYIKWPSEPERNLIAADFYNYCNIPGIVGVVDGCHIGMVPPSAVQKDFINRKMQHSMNLMAVCDRDLRFTFISAGECGRHHDSYVLKNSNLWNAISSGNAQNFFSDTKFHLIGDSAFELHPHLIVPYPTPKTRELTRTEKKFNYQLSKARACIENAFGFLKGRFRILKYRITADLPKIPDIIMACCVLHNICMNDSLDLSLRHLLERDANEECRAAQGTDVPATSNLLSRSAKAKRLLRTCS